MNTRTLLVASCVGLLSMCVSDLGTAAVTASDVSITKVDDKGGSSITSAIGSLVPGQPITYTIVVSNSGPDNATALQVSDPVLSAHPGVVTSDTWNLTGGSLTGTLHTFTLSGTWTIGNNVVTVASTTGLLVGSLVTGTGIPAGTVIVALGATTVTLSANAIASGTAQSITFSSPEVTDLASTSNLFVGQPVSGTGIPAGTVIAVIDSPTQITLSKYATTDGVQSLTFALGTTEVGTLHTFTLSGTWTSGNNVVTVASTTGLLVGSLVTGTGIPAGTTVVFLTATTVTLSANAIASGTAQSITFSSLEVTGLASTSSLFVGQPVSGTGIPAGTVIAFIDSPTQITLSKYATTNGVQSLTFTFSTTEVGTLHTFTLSGTWTSGNNVVTVASTTGLLVGSLVTGTGIPAGTTVVALGATTVTLSANATASGTAQSITFSSLEVTGLSDTSVLFVGESVAGTGIAAGTVIAFIDSPTEVTLNENATTNGPQTLTFGASFVTAGSPNSGTGDISIQVDLPVGAAVTIVVKANTNASATGTLSNIATVAVPFGDATPNDNTATDTVALLPTLAPSIAKTFGAASIALNGSTSLSFTITNPNASTALMGVGFDDTLPAGLVISTPNGLTGSCGGGTMTATAGSGSVSLASATLAASASCTFSVNVTGTTSGLKHNTTGAVNSTNGGTGNTASAALAVSLPITAQVPTLSTWALMLMAGLLLLAGMMSLSGRGR